MKKSLIIITFVLVITLVLPIVAVSADGIDLSTKSTEELLALKSEIDEEIDQRIGTIAPIYGGLYVVGKDIKAGKYVIHAKKATSSQGMYMVVARIDPNLTDLGSFSKVSEAVTETINNTYLVDGAKFMFTLAENMILYLVDVDTAYLQIVENPIWAP